MGREIAWSKGKGALRPSGVTSMEHGAWRKAYGAWSPSGVTSMAQSAPVKYAALSLM